MLVDAQSKSHSVESGVSSCTMSSSATELLTPYEPRDAEGSLMSVIAVTPEKAAQTPPNPRGGAGASGAGSNGNVNIEENENNVEINMQLMFQDSMEFQDTETEEDRKAREKRFL